MSTLRPSPGPGDQFLGSKHAATTLVEFGDFQCPHCRHAEPLISRLVKSMDQNIYFVFRHFPLQEAHPQAHMAALAAEAAGHQNKFWQMHHLLFANQDQLGPHKILDLAEELELDMQRFASDWKSPAITDKVEKDFESGIRSGVNGTPGFFLNGTKLMTYDGTYESLSDAIELDREMKGN